jgi:hypothetical protein
MFPLARFLRFLKPDLYLLQARLQVSVGRRQPVDLRFCFGKLGGLSLPVTAELLVKVLCLPQVGYYGVR